MKQIIFILKLLLLYPNQPLYVADRLVT